MRAVILGMNNPSDAHPGEALAYTLVPANASGARLQRMSGLSPSEYDAAFERMNLVGGRRWGPAAAMTEARAVKAKLRGRRIAVLGRSVWNALQLPHTLWFNTVHVGGAEWTLLPHPSGLNRSLNDAAMQHGVRICLTQLATTAAAPATARGAAGPGRSRANRATTASAGREGARRAAARAR